MPAPTTPDPRPSPTPSVTPIFLPKLISTLKSYSFRLFWNDLSAGMIVGIVALPLAIAFAIASGVSPDRGLVTAIVAGFLISTLGGSRVQIGGPTGAFVVIVYGIVEKHGIQGLTICCLLAGGLLVLMGLLRLGTIIKFIPYPLTIGFTTGIAVVIFSSQMKDFFGLHTATLPADFIEKWKIYFQAFHTLDAKTLALSGLAMAILLIWPRFNRKIPASLLAILIIASLVHLLKIPVETIESRFGALPTGLPRLTFPDINLTQIKELIGPAFTVAILGAIESLLSATVADGMIEGRHRPNTELIAQGIANIASPLFGGIPATGAIARTVTNVKNGGRTPVAGMVHAATLLIITLVFGRWAGKIPLCVLAAILVVVSYHMSEWHAFKAMLRAPRMDILVMLVTFFLTVFFDLTVAVEIGLLLSLVLFMKRMTDVTSVREISSEMRRQATAEASPDGEENAANLTLPEGVAVYETEGALFFGVAELFRDSLDIGDRPPQAMILRMRHVLALDATGLRALHDLKKQCDRQKIRFIISGVHTQPMFAMERSGFLELIGEDNLTETLDQAIARARHLLK